MIVNSLRCYVPKLFTIMKWPSAAPAATAKLHAVSGRTLLNRIAKLHTV
jgi:hypothetical protein